MAKTLKKIKQKLLNSSLTSLTRDELVIYLYYRLSNLVRESYVLTNAEIRYLLSDCGQGRFRFDPQLVDKLFDDIESNDMFVIKRKKSETVATYKILPSEIAEPIESTKAELVNSLQSIYTSIARCEQLAQLLTNLAHLAKIENEHVELKNSLIRLIGSLNGQKIIVDFHPDKWLYPYSQEIWTLYTEATGAGAMPIIIARRIHGTAFPVFKSMGILGFNSYYHFLPKDTVNTLQSFDANKFFDYGASLKKNGRMRIGHLLEIETAQADWESISELIQLRNFFKESLARHTSENPGQISQKTKFAQLTVAELSIEEQLSLFLGCILDIQNKRLQGNLRNWALWRLSIFSQSETDG